MFKLRYVPVNSSGFTVAKLMIKIIVQIIGFWSQLLTANQMGSIVQHIHFSKAQIQIPFPAGYCTHLKDSFMLLSISNAIFLHFRMQNN